MKHPRELEASAKRLAQAQRGHRKQLVSRLHERIGNQRRDRNHKLSHRLVAENTFISFSKDRIKGIAKKFGKSVASSAHAQLRQMLSYKSPKSGTEYVETDNRFSTQTCSNCGLRTGPKNWSGLSVTQWRCSACGAEHDRDTNAARNTLLWGLDVAHEVHYATA
jgi:putative transposase